MIDTQFIDHWRSCNWSRGSELADVVAKAVLDIPGRMESGLHQFLDAGLRRWALCRGDERVPLRRDLGVGGPARAGCQGLCPRDRALFQRRAPPFPPLTEIFPLAV